MQSTESVFTTTEKALWYLRSGLSKDFRPATVAHLFFLGTRRRRPAATGNFSQLFPMLEKGMQGYALFRVVYRPEHPYGYIVRVECLDEHQMRAYEAKRRLKLNEVALMALVIPTREDKPLLVGRCQGVTHGSEASVIHRHD